MKHCLVVDDSRVIRTIIRKSMEKLQFVVSEAADGSEALAACLKAMPDVCIVDWNMPVMNGIEFVRALRGSEGGGVPKVILCTTENEPAKIMEALSAGADEYIMKPFDTEILAGKLVQVGALEG